MASLKEAKFAAIYVRVSSKSQDHKSQLPDLDRWVEGHGVPVKWFKDKFTGKTMDRPGWRTLEDAIRAGQVAQVVVWRLDRLGRTASELTALFDELRRRKVNLVSLKDGIDLATAAGRLMANVIASVAQYDNEVRSERVRAGQAVAKATGKTWGGSKPGVPKKVSDVQAKMIHEMKRQGESIVGISAAVGLSRPTVYAVLSK
jgi:DNA invertase Pin-like site-specific DNA recombinase